MRYITIITMGLILSLLVSTVNPVQAERATQTEMELICQNWLSYMVYQKGTWAGNTHPQIVDINEIVEGDTVLARCFSIAPQGYVAVPILKELPPIMAYSDEYRLYANQSGGFSQLLKEFLLDRIRLYAEIYGSLDASQPPTGDVLLGRGHKAEWNRFLKSNQEFKSDLIQGKFQSLTEVGPLLTTSWHQRAPYNNFCPRGDTTCTVCPGGKPPTIPTVVGCVATATAQILRYWNWPPSGSGSHSYTWGGDYSCNGSSPPQNLYADFSDSYDWQNMPDSCDSGCPPQDSAALAELCYEVGVAFNMGYGVCGSGAYTADALTVFPTYFRYDPSIDEEDRSDHTAAEWFSIIQDEINHGRPMQYRIRSHSIVCDGWRDTGGQNQYHMNYGWGGSFTTWFAIDNLYCYWVLPDSLCPPMEEYLIRFIKPPEFIPFAPAVNYAAGSYPWSVFCADLDGDGDLDLAVANSGSNPVSILMNNGDGTFQPKVDYGAGNHPLSIFSADLDGDGDLDLAVANSYSDNVSILKNNGNGTFQPKTDYGAGTGPSSVFCADLDGDDDLDLAVANSYSDNVSILKNNGNGTFQLDSSYIVENYPRSVFCADLDGDLDLDLAVANEWNDRVSILKNNGDGTFQPKVDYSTGFSPLSVFCADLDGDSDLDLAIANSGFAKATYNTVSILRNQGNGTFQTNIDYDAGTAPVSVFCADLDGDGDLDISSANYESDSVSILENLSQVPANQPPNPFSLHSPVDGSGMLSTETFNWQIPYDPNFGDHFRYDLYVSTIPAFDPDSTTVYDSLSISRFNANLNVGTYYWKVKAYDNWGAERWSIQTWNFYVVSRGDVNGDRIIDVGDVVYLINYLFKTGSAPSPLEAGDANCDDIVDIGDVVLIINYLFKGGPPPAC